MRTSYIKSKSGLIGLSALLLATTASPALAQEEENEAAESTSEFTVSGNAALTSDYRFRGISFSEGDIAIQGGIDIAHDSGFYIGTWASSIEENPGGFPSGFGHTELDIYGGWSGEVSSGVSVDVGLLYYIYPDGDQAIAGNTDYFEPYASISGTLGPVEATLGAAYAWEQSSLGNQDNLYIYTDLSSGIPQTPITLNAHLGYTDGVLATSADGDTFDWSVGADWAITSKLTAGVKYVGMGGPKVNDFTDDTVVFTLGVAF